MAGLSCASPLVETVCQTPWNTQCFGSLSKTPTFIADSVPTYHSSLPTPSWKMWWRRVVGQLQHHLALCSRPGRWPESCSGSVHRQLLGDVHRAAHPYSHSFCFLWGCGVTSAGLGLSDLRRYGKWRPVGEIGTLSYVMPLFSWGRNTLSPEKEGDFPPCPTKAQPGATGPPLLPMYSRRYMPHTVAQLLSEVIRTWPGS